MKIQKKPSKRQIADYFNLLERNNNQMGLLKALKRQGYTDFDINKYLLKEGIPYDKSIELIRELNIE